MIDGQDIREVTQDSLRAAHRRVRRTRAVQRHHPLQHRLWPPDATQDEVEQAARQAQVHDFVQRLPDGYDTRVGERGLKTVGREKQRVAIARTILKNRAF